MKGLVRIKARTGPECLEWIEAVELSKEIAKIAESAKK